MLFKYLPNVTLTNQDTSMMDRFSQSQFEDLSLQAAFQEIFDFQAQNVIELHAGFIQDTNTYQTTQQGIT